MGQCHTSLPDGNRRIWDDLGVPYVQTKPFESAAGVIGDVSNIQFILLIKNSL
jgi:hypothetical protein